MTRKQDEDRRKRDARDEPERQPRKADSGDVSEQGRERRDDTDVYPAGRGAGDFGTHGGPNKHGAKNGA
ncbi:hypothetical protein [Corallococcus macrosporus]|uniref:Uncharacterized protein n=1 Tax=Corallococcus macrosporus DSM 14697 TaxID=1189310 RepID=A0A250K302_9BACT|nr:hypothetical protein [Corallococcus macrosporus]ATB50479.1 hypothetical protein MYMAC_006135 [Corallococcus macrosporus DSM 14697]